MTKLQVQDKVGCWTVSSIKGSKATCICDCGVSRVLRKYDLEHRLTLMCKSCASSGPNKTEDPTYQSYIHAKGRCLNRTDKDWDKYGGRGITMCDLWKDSYEAFLLCMGPRPVGTTLDRKDVNGHYEPGNCKWATIEEQNRNQRSNIRIEYLGKTRVLSEWIKELGLEAQEDAIRKRISRGMDPIEALTKEVTSRK